MFPSRKNYPYYDVKKIDNIKELLDNSYYEFSDEIAFTYTQNETKVVKTFKDVYEDAINVSNYFYSNFKNSHIALVGENSYNWVILFLGIILSGNIAVVIDKDTDEKHLKELLKNSDTKIIYYSGNYDNYVKNFKMKSFLIEDMPLYAKEGKSKENKYQINDDKDAVIFFTSGTTGANKAVVLSQKNMARDIYGASSLYEPVAGGSLVSFLPFHHAFGLITSVLMPIYYGVSNHICSSYKHIIDDFKEYKPDTLFAVPAIIEMFYKQIWKTARKQSKEKILKFSIRFSNTISKTGINLKNYLFKSIRSQFGNNLKYIICGGAHLDTKYVKFFRSIGVEILNGYGITECSPVVSVNRNHFHKDGSVGVPCRGVKVKIIDDEICIKGPVVFKGYYKDKKSTSKVIIDDYFHTGDLGYISKEGFIFITGRKKNVIILSNGENISPEMIEADLAKDKGVCEVIVYEKDNKLIASIYPEEEFLGDQEYFDNLIYKYNLDKPKNKQIAFTTLRNEEFIKNSSRKIIRSKAKEV